MIKQSKLIFVFLGSIGFCLFALYQIAEAFGGAKQFVPVLRGEYYIFVSDRYKRDKRAVSLEILRIEEEIDNYRSKQLPVPQYLEKQKLFLQLELEELQEKINYMETSLVG